MNKEIKTRWLNALRNGKYKQGKRRLKGVAGTYCCLGVLCDILKEDIGADWRNEMFLGSCQFLPAIVREKAELVSSDPNIKNESGILISLSDLNDNGRSFEEIAKYIEEQL
jgi:hypothetical protein